MSRLERPAVVTYPSPDGKPVGEARIAEPEALSARS